MKRILLIKEQNMDRVEELIQKSKLLVNKYKNLLETNKAQELKIKELEDEINKFNY